MASRSNITQSLKLFGFESTREAGSGIQCSLNGRVTQSNAKIIFWCFMERTNRNDRGVFSSFHQCQILTGDEDVGFTRALRFSHRLGCQKDSDMTPKTYTYLTPLPTCFVYCYKLEVTCYFLLCFHARDSTFPVLVMSFLQKVC